MADVQVIGNSNIGNSLYSLLTCAEIQPGDQASYQLCKTILSYHPLGAKMAESPIKMAQSQARRISIQKGPESKLLEAFRAEWKELGATKHIRNWGKLARAYGVSSIALLCDEVPTNEPIDYEKLHELTIGFNVLDPLNTAGSLVLNQDPNAIDFQKVSNIRVGGKVYHRSRAITAMNEEPIYIQYTTSAFGFVGRSVYQRPLFPLKSYIQALITDDLITLKAGVIVAKMKQPGSIIDAATDFLFGQKRQLVKEAQTGNVLGISIEEEIESLNLQNLEAPYSLARKNILGNIATGADMPAILLNQETFAEGFGEGTEDANKVAQYIADVREWLDPGYEFFDKICMYRAWNPEFYKVIQKEFPEEYGDVGYKEAFYEWRNSFVTEWPNFREEPDSEKIKVEDVILKAAIAVVEVLMPALDPENKAAAIEWVCDVFNSQKMLFNSPLVLDFDALANFVPETPLAEPGEPKPFAAQDSEWSGRVEKAQQALSEAMALLPARPERKLKVLSGG